MSAWLGNNPDSKEASVGLSDLTTELVMTTKIPRLNMVMMLNRLRQLVFSFNSSGKGNSRMTRSWPMRLAASRSREPGLTTFMRKTEPTPIISTM